MANVLVVDDEHNIRMMIGLALKQSGHTVETAADGNEALDKFGDGSGWDLVLLDQRMPGLEGITVLKQMRHESPGARVIMITAFGTVDLAVEALKAGATDFLRKPFTTETLRGAVRTALEKSGGPPPPGEARSGITFSLTTINGYRIESQRGASVQIGSETGFRFTVRSPDGAATDCTVVLPRLVMELVKAHTDREQMPGGDRFWQALCEEVLANYVYQNADAPSGGVLTIPDLTPGMRRWVDAVLNSG